MVVVTPKRSREQRLAALAYANKVRLYRAAVKIELETCRLSLLDLRDDPMMATAKIGSFLTHVPKIGAIKAGRFMRYAGLAPSKTFAGATDRQWQHLTDTLNAECPVFREAEARVQQHRKAA